MVVLAQESIPRHLFGSLRLVGTSSDRVRLKSAYLSYRQLLSKGLYHLPLFLVHDLHHLISAVYQTRFTSDEPTTSLPGDLRHLVSRYERECLGRLLQTSHFISACEIVATDNNPHSFERLLELVATAFYPSLPEGPEFNPAFLRDLSPPTNTESYEWPQEDKISFWEDFLTHFLSNVNQDIQWNQLIQEEDLYELAHHIDLPTDNLRIGCRQLISLHRSLASANALQDRIQIEEGENETAFLDETTYPTGGITGLTNRGSFESLVMSELSYMDEGTEDFSLFDLRFVENEILYYLRDSGSLRRKRRTIHFIVDIAPILNTKALAYSHQFGTLVQGLIIRIITDLSALFSADSLRFHIHYLSPSDRKSMEVKKTSAFHSQDLLKTSYKLSKKN